MSQIAPAPLTGTFVTRSSNLDIALAIPVGNVAAAAPYRAIGGQVTGTQPLSENAAALSGEVGTGAIDIFYNRILIEPADVDVGNLLTDQAYTVNVFNAYLTPRTVSSFTASGNEGIAVGGLVTAPFNIGALQMLSYVFTVSTDGPFAIDARYVLVINGVSYTIALRGSRLVLLPFRPDWKDGCVESMEWKTNIIRTFTGHEQRRQLRQLPRAELSYSTILHAEQARQFENLMWGWQNRSFGVPFWPDKTVTTGSITAGAITIPVNTAGYSFKEGALVVLYNSDTDLEVAEIDTVTSSLITVVSPLARSWPSGSTIYPGFVGHLPTAFQMRRLTDRLITGTLSFQADPSAFTGYAPTASAPVALNGIEIVTARPNWSADFTWEYQYQFDAVDYGGAIKWSGTEERPRVLRSFRWLLSNRTELRLFREQLARMRGMARAVYIPSWNDDFTLLASVAPSDAGLLLSDNGFSRYVGDDVSRDGLMIRLRNGTVIYRHITGVSSTLSGLNISLSQSLGVAFGPADVVAVNLMTKYRLASDRVEIKWGTDRVATVEANFISVPE